MQQLKHSRQPLETIVLLWVHLSLLRWANLVENFPGFLLFLLAKCFNETITASLHILSSSLFTGRLTMRRCILCVTDNVAEWSINKYA
jgi:uncharacterized membrane protein YecN with MAPEG domain